MAQTIISGDWLWLDKTTYGARIPVNWSNIPVLNIFACHVKDENRDWGYRRLKGTRNPQIGDVIVFNSPEHKNRVLVKRIVALPGDSLYIQNGNIFLNKHFLIQPATIMPISQNTNSLAEFPNQTHWTMRNYGPIYLPKKGEMITINSENVLCLNPIIRSEGNCLIVNDGKLYVNGVLDSIYRFEHSYYFVMGDNQSNSRDSRSFGYISEELIIGKFNFVLFSVEPEVDFWSGIRWERLLRRL